MKGIIDNYTFLIDFFKEEIILDNLMAQYKDFSYVNFILNLPFDRGYRLYKKCIDNIKDKLIEKGKDRIFQVWLVDLRLGYKGDFETYYKRHVKVSETNNMTRDEKTAEEERIIKKMEGMDNKKFKTRRLRL